MQKKFLKNFSDFSRRDSLLYIFLIIVSISTFFTSCIIISERVFHKKIPKIEKREFKRYSLFISNSSYKFWSKTPISYMNAAAMEAFFNKVAYADKDKVFFRMDLKKNKLVNILNSFSNEGDENTQLLLYYSGHGFRDEETNISYVIPIDGKFNSVFVKNKEKDLNWVNVQDMINIISRSKAFQKILIFDSCNMGNPEDYKFKLECRRNESLNPGIAILASTYEFQYAIPELQERLKKLNYVGLSYLTRWFLQGITAVEYRRFLDKKLSAMSSIFKSIRFKPYPLSKWDEYMRYRHPSKSVVSNEYLFEDNVVDLFEIYEYIMRNWDIEPGSFDIQYPTLFGKGTTFFPIVDRYCYSFIKNRDKKNRSRKILEFVIDHLGYSNWDYNPLVNRSIQLCAYHCQYLSDDFIKENLLKSNLLDDLTKIEIYYILAKRGDLESISKLKYIETNSKEYELRHAAHTALLSISSSDEEISDLKSPNWCVTFSPLPYGYNFHIKKIVK